MPSFVGGTMIVGKQKILNYLDDPYGPLFLLKPTTVYHISLEIILIAFASGKSS